MSVDFVIAATKLPSGVSIHVTERRTNPNANQPPWDNAALNRIEIGNVSALPLFLLEDAEDY